MASGFAIYMDDKGHCDVHRNGRAFRYDAHDLDEALVEIRRVRNLEEPVYIHETDGGVITHTRQGKAMSRR